MKVFSYKKYCAWCDSQGLPYAYWASLCDGQPINNGGNVTGTTGDEFFSDPVWEEEYHG